MSVQSTVAETTLVEKVVLLGVVVQEAAGNEPARPDEIRSVCNDRLDEVTGRLSEADVSRALNRLEATELLEQYRPDDRSPVGKGRPTYALAVESGSVLDALADDEQVGSLAGVVREREE